jgi:glutamine synthetase
MSADKILKTIEEDSYKFVDLRFCDTMGKEQHVSLPISAVDEDLFEEGKMFDGSSISGWKDINESDMVLMPDVTTAVKDPFAEHKTLIIRCDVLEPNTMEGYNRCPRSLGKRAEAYLKSSGIADTAYFGPEPEFFIFDDVRFDVDMHGCSYYVDSEEGAWNTGAEYEGGNIGHRPGVKGGYFPVPPVDSLYDLRGSMCRTLEKMGIGVEVHHHEVGTAGQCEIGTRFNTLVRKADELLMLKYVVQNVAHAAGKTATFMPKPLGATTAPACTCTSRSPRAARTCLPARVTVGCRRRRSTTSPASSSTPARSTPSPIRPPTATSAWCRASRRRSCSPTRRATVRRPAEFRSSQTRRDAASRCASATRPAIPT